VEQIRMYLAVADIAREFDADCLRVAVPARSPASPPPERLLRGPLQLGLPSGERRAAVLASTEADQGNLVPMELMKRVLVRKKLHPAVMFHDVRWGAKHDGRFLWVLLNSGSCGAYAFNHDPKS
jgi:hypothetical protein